MNGAANVCTSQSDLYVCESPSTHQLDVVSCDQKSSKSAFFIYVFNNEGSYDSSYLDVLVFSYNMLPV